MPSKLRLYTIDLKYIRNLHRADNNIPSVSPQIGKAHRLFLGIVVVCNNRKYCIPLSSPKPKHQTMKEKIDFSKIYNDNGKLIAVLNFNYMLPVKDSMIHKYDFNIKKTDNTYWRQYKSLCRQELNWCRQHEKNISDKAKHLYLMYIRGEQFTARNRCLNFPKLETICDRY